MEGALKLWIVIVAVGALNYAVAAVVHRRLRAALDAGVARARAQVRAGGDADRADPADDRLGAGATPRAAGADPKVLAALAAAVVAFHTRSTLKTLAAGMLALWLLQWLIGAHG